MGRKYGERRKEIEKLLKEGKLKGSDIARKVGCFPSYVYHVKASMGLPKQAHRVDFLRHLHFLKDLMSKPKFSNEFNGYSISGIFLDLRMMGFPINRKRIPRKKRVIGRHGTKAQIYYFNWQKKEAIERIDEICYKK